MDRSLDERISDRQGGSYRGNRNRRQHDWPRDGARKSNGKNENTDIDTDWLHDKYEDDPETRRPLRGSRPRRADRYSPEADTTPQPGARLRVENLHYDLTEDELEDLFARTGPLLSLSLRYDRAGRSSGTALVTYASLSSARLAIREYDGANANGQPIRLTLLPSGPAAASVSTNRPRNPFDTAQKPSRSLFERVEFPDQGRDRGRSRSPGAPRRTDTTKPPPEGVDRYVPGMGGGERSRSPGERFGGRGRRGGAGREREGSGWRERGERGGGGGEWAGEEDAGGVGSRDGRLLGG
ncbi:MAG: hypothetical protein FRX48_02334 [Lasallia pustulata]|uniref:RRM domain-containing protein n=1 Tax=Lasallia pustulata TaxID=136370 RepID=A0A5M8PYE5_9LECA|nr:MAG: hypothetical protein FRX48_02334 [Lasallia pustulata]